MEVDRAALWTETRQLVCLKFTLATQAPGNTGQLSQSEHRVPEQCAFLFHNIETELHVLAGMAYKRIELDLDAADALRALGNRLLFHRGNEVSYKVNFVHKLYSKVRVRIQFVNSPACARQTFAAKPPETVINYPFLSIRYVPRHGLPTLLDRQHAPRLGLTRLSSVCQA